METKKRFNRRFGKRKLSIGGALLLKSMWAGLNIDKKKPTGQK